MSVGSCVRRSLAVLSLSSFPSPSLAAPSTPLPRHPFHLSQPLSLSSSSSPSFSSSSCQKPLLKRQFHSSITPLCQAPLISERGRPNIIAFHSSLQKVAQDMNQMREQKGEEETGAVLGGMTETAAHTANIIREMHLISPFSSSSLSLFLSSTAKQWSVSSTTRLISLVFSSLTPSSTNEEETIEESGEERKLKVLGESLGMCMRQRSQHDAGSLLFHFVNQNCHPSSSSSSSQYIEHLSLLVGSSVARLKFGHERKNDETTVTPNTIITETPFWGDEDVGYLLLCFRHDLTQMWKEFHGDFKYDDFDFVCELVSSIVKESGRERDDRFTEHLINSCLSSWEQSEQDKRIEDVIGRISEKIDRPSRIKSFFDFFSK